MSTKPGSWTLGPNEIVEESGRYIAYIGKTVLIPTEVIEYAAYEELVGFIAYKVSCECGADIDSDHKVDECDRCEILRKHGFKI